MEIGDIDKAFTFTEGDGTKYACKSGHIRIKLTEESKTRYLGEVYRENGKMIYKKSDDESQIHRKTKSWSIPDRIFMAVDEIIIKTEQFIYRVVCREIKSLSVFRHFRYYERKIYIPLKYWNRSGEQQLSLNF